MKHTLFFLVALLITTFLFPRDSYALYEPCGLNQACPANLSCINNKCQDVATVCSLQTVFANVVSVAGILVGFGFFVMVIIAGIRYLMSGGDPKALQAAKGTLTWAIIGLALFALSYTILLLVRAFTGVDVTVFKIGNC